MAKQMLSTENYEYETWGKTFPNEKVNLSTLKIHSSWKKLIKDEIDENYFDKLEKFLSKCLKVTKGDIKIYPYPDLVFNAFNTTPFNKIKVVILGQDPYHNNEEHKDEIIPQAMGLSFSIPVGIKVPSSLKNIYKNQLKFKQIKDLPDHGNLILWAKQGCLMLNTSLTVQHGHPNSHSKHWKPFTDTIIKTISDNKENVVFMLWGAPALGKLNLIDTKKHKVIISSHPSGLSCHKPLRTYKCFMDEDHFGKTNKFLIKNKKKPIEW
jgi:uracil-DNA glycosylase